LAVARAKPEPAPLVQAIGVRKYFYSKPSLLARKLAGQETRFTKAVDGVDLYVGHGETLGLVGESGCGKSTLGRLLVGLYTPTAGEVIYEEGTRKTGQMIFQNPYASLNPRHTVRQILGNALERRGVPFQDREAESVSLLERVGLAAAHLDQFPRQFSGGQRQRIGIARALAMQPSFIVADEPVSALDVSVQAQILNLLQRLQAESNVSFLLVSHDLAVVHHISHRVSVMYLGKIVETGPTESLFEEPLHPYTRALLSAIPRIGDGGTSRIHLQGTVPSAADPPKGCRFSTRCPNKLAICSDVEPEPWSARGCSRHVVWCHLYS
jgi:oligopeptide/dipeptide ABC transporter ATP-binding protein